MEKEELLQMLKMHGEGMKKLSLSMAIIYEDEIHKFYYDGENIIEEVPQLIYEIGSVTKTFTAALLMKLVSEGKIKLSDSIDRFFPEVKWNLDEFNRNVAVPTILQLVTHTSGMGNDIDCSTEEAGMKLEKKLMKFTGDFENDCIYGYLDEEDYIETLRAVNWDKVDHEFQYSNIGLSLLGIILQRVTGMTYDKAMQQYINEELGLKNTWLDIPRKVPEGYSIATPIGINQGEKDHWIWNRKIGMAAGGIYSSLEDMISYMKSYLTNTPKYLNDCHNKQLAYSDVNNFGIGVTWIKDGDITWHNGATGCFHSFVGFNKKHNMAVVILENHHEINEISIDDIGRKILALLKYSL